MPDTITVTIEERGNGLPDVGAYVPGDDGSLYRVATIDPRIQTAQPGQRNYMHATVERADWSACAEEDEFPAMVCVPRS